MSLAVEGELTVPYAAERKDELLAALRAAVGADGGTFELDLSGVVEMDTAGLQLVLLLQREAAHVGGSVRLVEPSTAVRDVLELAGLGGSVGLGAQAGS